MKNLIKQIDPLCVFVCVAALVAFVGILLCLDNLAQNISRVNDCSNACLEQGYVEYKYVKKSCFCIKDDVPIKLVNEATMEPMCTKQSCEDPYETSK